MQMVIGHILPLRQVLFNEDSEDDAILEASIAYLHTPGG